jgi:predicted amidophosphoribosyltransferase
MVICHCEGAIYPHWPGVSGCEKACPHDDLEGWCDPCGKPADRDSGCRTCGPYVTRACILCGAVEQPDGTFSL